jgi:hypothetical protein
MKQAGLRKKLKSDQGRFRYVRYGGNWFLDLVSWYKAPSPHIRYVFPPFGFPWDKNPMRDFSYEILIPHPKMANQSFSASQPMTTNHSRSITESNFRIPLYRDIMMLHGMASVSKPSCKNILSKGAGEAITIVIGGASESLSAHPGTADLTLKKRFGFVKIAIREGADLVPVFSFGENDVSVCPGLCCRYEADSCCTDI